MKRCLAIVFALLIAASPALATIASVGTLTSTPGTSTSSGTTVVATASAAASVGDLALCFVSGDNIQTSDGPSTDISFADSLGNIYDRVIEETIDVGGAGTGVVSGWFKSTLTNAIAISDTFTATFSSAIVAKVTSCWRFTVGAAVEVPASGTAQGRTEGTGDAQTITLSGLASQERLYFRAEGVQSNSVSPRCWDTPSTSFSEMTAGTASTGVSNDSISACAEFLISTSDGAVSDPGPMAGTQVRQGVMGALQQVGGAPAVNFFERRR